MFRRLRAARPVLEPLELRCLLTGAPDPGFGIGGRFVGDFGSKSDAASAVAIQSDGRIIVSGDGDTADLIRLTANGQRDNSFVYPAAMAASGASFGDIAIQPDGKIIAVGTQRSATSQFFVERPAVARFNSDGSLDTSFGTGGVVLPIGDSEHYGYVAAVQILTNGKILIGGNIQPGGGQDLEFIGRLNANGSFDTSFGTGGSGFSTVDFKGTGFDEMSDFVLLPDGKIFMGGWGYGADAERITVARFTASGAVDTSFDGDGVKNLPVTPGSIGDEIDGMTLRPDGKIVIVGKNVPSGDERQLIGLIDSSGNFQSDFGTSGRVTIDTGGDIESLGSVTLDSFGRIFATGGSRDITFPGGSYNWNQVVISLRADGTPDPTFNGGVPVVVDTGGNYDAFGRNVLASPSRLIVAGRSGNNGTTGANNGGSDWTVNAFVVSPPSTGAGTPVRLTTGTAAYVRDGTYAGQNFGSATELQLKKSSSAGSTREFYVKFDLSSVSSVASAVLRLNGKIDHATQTAQVAVYPVSDTTWAENTITWNNRPGTGANALATQTVATATAKWYEFDVTSYLAAEKAAGRNVVTLAVRSLTATDPYLIFSSDEATSNQPELVVTPQGGTSLPPPPQTLVVSPDVLNVPEGTTQNFSVRLSKQPTADVTVGIARSGGDNDLWNVADTNAINTTLTFTPSNWNVAQLVPVYAQPDADTDSGGVTFHVFSQGLISRSVVAREVDNNNANEPPPANATLRVSPEADAYVRDGAFASTNFGAAPELIAFNDLFGTGEDAITYIRVPLSGFNDFTSATLRLFGHSSSSTQAAQVELWAVPNLAWNESTINYNTRPTWGNTTWQTRAVTGTTSRWYDFDVTRIIQYHRQTAPGTTSITFVFRGSADGGATQAIFASDENPTAANRPYLAVAPTGVQPPPPQAIVLSTAQLAVPEGSASTVGVQLATAPASDVIVSVARGSGDTDLNTNKSTLTFTPSNWNIAQDVSINAAQDTDIANGTATFTFSATGVPVKILTASEVDDDAPVTLTLRASADSYVRDGTYAGQNFGSETQLIVKRNTTSSNTRETYLRFPISDFTGATAATLRIFAKSNSATQNVGLGLFGADNITWSETGITWNNKPATTTAAMGVATVSGTADQWYDFDVTSYVQQQKAAGAAAVTFVLKAANNTDAQAVIESDETATASSRPQLVVTVGTPPPPPQGLVVSTTQLAVPEGSNASFTVKLAVQPTSDVTVAIARTSGDTDLSAAASTLTFTAANWNIAQSVQLAAAQDADTLSGSALFTISSTGLSSKTVTATEVEDDVPAGPTVLHATADAYVRDGTYAAQNFGAATELQLKKSSSAGSSREIYLKFDLTSAANISSAKLRLWGRIDSSTERPDVAVFGAADTSWSESGINWNNRPAAGASALATTTVATSVSQWYEWDVTSYLAAQKAAGATSVTLVVRSLASTTPYLIFNSDEAATNRPELVIN